MLPGFLTIVIFRLSFYNKAEKNLLDAVVVYAHKEIRTNTNKLIVYSKLPNKN
jgi:hypothetical protein